MNPDNWNPNNSKFQYNSSIFQISLEPLERFIKYSDNSTFDNSKLFLISRIMIQRKFECFGRQMEKNKVVCPIGEKKFINSKNIRHK